MRYAILERLCRALASSMPGGVDNKAKEDPEEPRLTARLMINQVKVRGIPREELLPGLPLP